MEITVFTVLLGITALFFIFLLVKSLFSVRGCVLCTAITVSWVVLLLLYKMGWFNNLVLLALLLGQTVVGIFYLVEKKVKEELTLFRLPFLLTLTLGAYSLLQFPPEFLKILVFLTFLWWGHILLYLYREKPAFQGKVKRLIECCKGW
ncbi:MAG: hypothetical protein AABX13_01355 [Nanoarchaeota archaeon]